MKLLFLDAQTFFLITVHLLLFLAVVFVGLMVFTMVFVWLGFAIAWWQGWGTDSMTASDCWDRILKRSSDSRDILMERYWINQPSTLQDDHKLHGRQVLARVSRGDKFTTVYFVSGDIVSSRLSTLALSKGWPKTSKP